MVDEQLELLGTPGEMRELMDVLVRNCGCGCSYDGGDLVSPTAGCAALRAQRERRFILGMLFARRLRCQLETEERTRTPPPTHSSRRLSSEAAAD
jgi:hypothetical protein